jgi:hypothetical protein
MRRIFGVAALALLLAACGGGDDSEGDGATDVDACLEEANTPEEEDTCTLGESLDDVNADGFIECVEEGVARNEDDAVQACEDELQR